MKLDLEKIKALVEAGDTSALQSHIYESLEKGDIKSAAEANKEVKSELDSVQDQHHTKALETWKTKNLQKLIDEEVAKKNPSKSPEQIALDELKAELAAEKRANQREKLKNHALTVATEKNLPKDIVDFLLVDSGEDYDASLNLTNQNLSKFESTIRDFEKNVIEAKFKEQGRDFPGGSNKGNPSASKFGADLGKDRAKNNDLDKARDAYFQ